MASLKYKVEKLFGNMAHGICRNPIKTLLLMFMLIGALISQMPKLTIDTSFEGMLHPDNPLRIEYNGFRDQFGQDRVIICAVQTPEIFNAKHLGKLKAFHHDLEREVPHLDEVKSLINARRTRGEGDTLIVEDLLKDWPEKPVDLAALKTYVLHNPVYRNDYISEDGTIAALIIKPIAAVEKMDEADLMADFEESSENSASESEPEPEPAKGHYLSKKENKDVVDAVNRIMERYQAPDFSIALTGGPVLEEVYDSHTKKNMRTFTFIMMIVIFLSLGLFFRRLSGAVYPLMIVYLSLLSTLGVMAICKVSISVFSVVLPSFLMAVGIADAVHILAIFYRRYQQGHAKIDSIAFALGHSGLAIVMTSLTTIAGLLSFSMSELSSIGHLGIFASVGVALALIYTVIMLPALLAITPIKMKKTGVDIGKKRVMDTILVAIGNFASGNPKKIVVISMMVMALSLAFMLDLKFSHHHKNIYPPEMTVRQDQEFIDGNLKGAASVEVVLDTRKENGLYQPEVLHRLDRLTEELLGIRDGEIYIGKVRSINDILKETNQALHANDPAFYAIPDEQALIAQELLLFENSGSDDLEKIVDGTFSKTRVSIKIPYLEVLLTEKLSDDIYNRFRNYFDGLASVTITGMSPMMGKTVAAAIRSMCKSYVVAFFVITIMMIILVGDVKMGLLSMIPNVFPIFLVMGIMGALGVYVDLNALMIGSIAIGMVVDDTMHFMYNFRRYYELSGDACVAVRDTLLSAGRAMMITSLVLAASFFTLLFATFTSTHKFGFFTGLVILIALLANFVMAPALVVLTLPYLKLKSLMPGQPATTVIAQQHTRVIKG